MQVLLHLTKKYIISKLRNSIATELFNYGNPNYFKDP